jgi:hypothetical protein
MDRNIFTNFSNRDRALNFDSLRVILECYEFKIKDIDYERIERESSKKQNSLRFELVVPNIDDTDYVC